LILNTLTLGFHVDLDTCYKRMGNGTPYYIAPEIFGNPLWAPKTLLGYIQADYWALGVTILEMIAGVPFLDYYAKKNHKELQTLDDVSVIDKQLSKMELHHKILKIIV